MVHAVHGPWSMQFMVHGPRHGLMLIGIGDKEVYVPGYHYLLTDTVGVLPLSLNPLYKGHSSLGFFQLLSI